MTIKFSHILILIILLSGCTQKPAPVSLRGEEFHGRREVDDKNEYHLIKDYNDKVKDIYSQNSKIIINNLSNSNKKAQTKCKFIMPIKGNITSSFKNVHTGDNMCNEGISIQTDDISDVKTSADGKVLHIGKGLRWYGNLIIIEHDKYTITLYSYLHNIYVKVGEKVKQGQVIASIVKNNSKTSNNPVLCFSMRKNGNAVNPLSYINCK
ncbi:M23 family metallopeptidase [Neoehrlichia mikurensis]|uniref:M23 family metallopeptidase n=1 Tax=Neoehrlichia mikurensis TaxID=89586 RepID=A0A9Q9BWG8_9RICK|nr:M23 family metallopeptidase [Neoehrlichia mikurensis]QXK93251.1 M23 family metallopeptidase [Neoehrlichia mikurensis]QXK94097.1 M23 family metallopeptidase [Neoehrlichia mikurensis]UTO55991.1 M23 family metallopeptidase [Neoehrlichia mikurensis]UTO56906.1 M23 family metallopeptidase [Neoehrlichia mikurensis]